MINLATAIYQAINNAHEYRTYQGIAPKDSTYPFVSYRLLPVESTESDKDFYTLEVSCWDKAESDYDTSHGTVMGLAGNVKRGLIQFRYMDEFNWISVERPFVGYVPDPDPMIKRYDVTATLQVYRRDQYESSRI